MNITVHIGRLILDGLTVTPEGRLQLKAAVEAELARLLVEGGLTANLQTGSARPSVRARAIQLTGEATPTQIGQQIAQAAYGGITQ